VIPSDSLEPDLTLPRLYDYGVLADCYKVRLLLAQLGERCERG